MTPKVWFITGSSSGFDRAVTDFDVSDSAAIPRAFSKAVEAFGRVDIVFNNVGYVLLGVAETTPEAATRRQFDVNFWGAVNVSREAIRVFREVNCPPGGKLLQNSSVCIWGVPPTMSYYSATKTVTSAEGFTESLAAEIDPEWNIKITLIEPGAFQTGNVESDTGVVFLELPPVYAKPDTALAKFSEWLKAKSQLPGDPIKAAAVIHKLAALESLTRLCTSR